MYEGLNFFFINFTRVWLSTLTDENFLCSFIYLNYTRFKLFAYYIIHGMFVLTYISGFFNPASSLWRFDTTLVFDSHNTPLKSPYSRMCGTNKKTVWLHICLVLVWIPYNNIPSRPVYAFALIGVRW